MKKPFDPDEGFPRIEAAIASRPKAALFELAEDGFNSVFEQLVACIISIRTYDETMLPAAKRLFAVARTPRQMTKLLPDEIDELIRDCTFHEPKARQIHDIARIAVEQHEGELPCRQEVLLSLRGVGPKCANLVLGIACREPFIGVDVHVHRVTNRWGYVAEKTPEKTMLALQQKLPRDYWIDINRLLVPFGKHICTGKLPKCSTCPVLEMCKQVGVERHR
jgi:endonuclease-3